MMNDSNAHELIRSICDQNLFLSTELSAERIQDLQAAFSIMDTQSKGYIGAEDISKVAEAAGI